jgi:hypothetical protein
MCAFSIATAFQNNSLSLLVAAYLNGEMVSDATVWLFDFPTLSSVRPRNREQ